jgi:hypothetical protein
MQCKKRALAATNKLPRHPALTLKARHEINLR